MSEPVIDWRTIEDKMLRQAAKAEAFRALFGGGSAERVPGGSPTGRMRMAAPPMCPMPRRKLGD